MVSMKKGLVYIQKPLQHLFQIEDICRFDNFQE